MTDLQNSADQIFGSNLVAMVTPMHPDGTISEPGLNLVDHLLTTGCDGIVVGGTTGESPTLTEAEAARLVGAVAARSKNRARVIAGIGTYDTAVSIQRSREAEAAGEDALLLVCPLLEADPGRGGGPLHGGGRCHRATGDVPSARGSRWRRPRSSNWRVPPPDPSGQGRQGRPVRSDVRDGPCVAGLLLRDR